MRVLILFLLAAPLAAQEAPVFARLAGSWQGEGALFGRPAAFTMRWELKRGDVALLTFANAMAGDTCTPVLEATAVYRTAPAHADAHWTDSRGVLITIRWEATDSTLTAHWEAPTERGRTEYRVTADGIEVRDFVHANGADRQFGTARYRRADTPSLC